MAPAEEKHTISVCVAIPTYNRERVLVDTIRQVLSQNPFADEVLVIDQTLEHEPETEAFLSIANSSGQIKWIKHTPPNLNRARNRALDETHCDVLILIDDDIELKPLFIEKHVRNFQNPLVVAVCGRVLQAMGNIPPENQQPWLRQFNCNYYNGWGTQRVEGVAGFWGGNHSLRVNVIREFGGFDNNYFGYLFDESDLAIRLWKAGRLIVYDPEAELLHLAVPTGGCRGVAKSNPEFWGSFSAIYFHMKHFYPRWYFWKQVFGIQFRRRALRKEIILHPWRIPWATLSYAYSFILACRLCIRHSILTDKKYPRASS